VFVNFTNHPSASWSEKQLSAAKMYGEIVDIPFPLIPPTWKEARLDQLADEYSNEILSHHPAAVLCHGESTFAYRVISRLLQQNALVLGACSERLVTETLLPDGKTTKTSVYDFKQFRSYGDMKNLT